MEGHPLKGPTTSLQEQHENEILIASTLPTAGFPEKVEFNSLPLSRHCHLS